MGYRVRNADGELHFPSVSDLGNAYRGGLVDPNDDVLDEHTKQWKKASEVMGYARKGKSPITAHGLQVTFAVILCLAAVYFAIRGRSATDWFLAIALALLGLLSLSRINREASQVRRSPRGR